MGQNKTAYARCSSCGSRRVRRSRRRGFTEHVLLRLLWVRPFHCMDCYKRFYSFSKRIEAQDRQSVATTPGPAPPAPLAPPQEQPHSEESIPEKPTHAERRAFNRVHCRIPARIVVGSGSLITGVVSGISLGGCFIETRDAVSVGSEIQISLEVQERTDGRALVRRSLPGTGMGVEFTFMTVPNFRRLQSIAKNSVRLDTLH